jgi:hypothetical protein
MPVEAFITTGDRSVISYLTRPPTDQIARKTNRIRARSGNSNFSGRGLKVTIRSLRPFTLGISAFAAVILLLRTLWRHLNRGGPDLHGACTCRRGAHWSQAVGVPTRRKDGASLLEAP